MVQKAAEHVITRRHDGKNDLSRTKINAPALMKKEKNKKKKSTTQRKKQEKKTKKKNKKK